jgi:hypothetical protein
MTTESASDKPHLSPREQAKALIALQGFEGSFPLSASLAAIIGAPLQDLEARLTQFAPVAVSGLKAEEERRLWATVLAVSVFEGKLAGEAEMWELVVEKARGWITGLSAGDENVKRLERLAGEVLRGLRA